MTPASGTVYLSEAERGLFADDRGLANWLADRLDDDHFYLTAARDRLRETPEAAPVTLTGGRATEPTGGPAPAPGKDDEDIALTVPERASLLQALARAFPTDAAAEAVLSLVGYGRERRPNLDTGSPRSGWAEILDEWDRGAVRAPYRRILAAALVQCPNNNPVFRGLARRHSVEAAEFDDPDS